MNITEATEKRRRAEERYRKALQEEQCLILGDHLTEHPEYRTLNERIRAATRRGQEARFQRGKARQAMGTLQRKMQDLTQRINEHDQREQAAEADRQQAQEALAALRQRLVTEHRKAS